MVKFIVLPVIIIAALVVVFFNFRGKENNSSVSPLNNIIPQAQTQNDNNQSITVVAQNLDTPWAIAFLPDGSMFVTERGGRVRLVDSKGNLLETPVATITNAREIGEGGLMGIALHPEYSSNNYVYLYYTYSETGGNTLNRVVRMTYRNAQLVDETIIVDRIPGATNHDGGRIKFGPDGMLYISTGDAGNPSQSQDTNSLAGKILRVTPEGKAADGNPFNNLVYSLGHRNPQGLAWDSQGRLWSTEHGPSGGESGEDELNLIEKGNNYGWPTIRGDLTRNGLITPKRHSGKNSTWAPSGMAIVNDSVFFGGLRGQTLYQVSLDNNFTLKSHFESQYGRIREVILGPDNILYITTSNKDGRGAPKPGDDKIIRINPASLL